jgi:hypothetical protein
MDPLKIGIYILLALLAGCLLHRLCPLWTSSSVGGEKVGKRRLDQSFSATTWRKSLTGEIGVTVDWSQFVISRNGELQLAPNGADRVFSPAESDPDSDPKGAGAVIK